MFELVAVLTVVFAGYVLYEVFKTVSETNKRTSVAASKPGPSRPAGEPKASAGTPAEPKPAPATPEPVVTASAEPTAPAEPESASASSVAAESPAPPAEKTVSLLKNPATGETCAVPTNYRFAKKWVKEALVAEGLLDKVYKATDLDDQTSQAVKNAIERLKGIEKYQA